MKKINFIFLFSVFALAASCSQIKTAIDNAAGSQPLKLKAPAANLTKDVKFASSDAHIGDESAIIVSVLSDKRFYIGDVPFPLEELSYKISRLLEKNPSERQLIYLNSEAQTEYGDALKILDILRKSGVENVGLIVDSNQKNAAPFHYILKIKISAEPKVEDIPTKPNPFTLILSTTKDGKTNLNREALGLDEITSKLAEIFKERELMGVFRVGTNDIEKSITVKAPRSAGCRDIILLIDAATGASASPVYLQIDDLEL